VKSGAARFAISLAGPTVEANDPAIADRATMKLENLTMIARR
jgi:hypothetical protein